MSLEILYHKSPPEPLKAPQVVPPRNWLNDSQSQWRVGAEEATLVPCIGERYQGVPQSKTDQEILKNWIYNFVRSMRDHPDTDTFVEALEDSCSKE